MNGKANFWGVNKRGRRAHDNLGDGLDYPDLLLNCNARTDYMQVKPDLFGYVDISIINHDISN